MACDSHETPVFKITWNNFCLTNPRALCMKTVSQKFHKVKSMNLIQLQIENFIQSEKIKCMKKIWYEHVRWVIPFQYFSNILYVLFTRVYRVRRRWHVSLGKIANFKDNQFFEKFPNRSICTLSLRLTQWHNTKGKENIIIFPHKRNVIKILLLFFELIFITTEMTSELH